MQAVVNISGKQFKVTENQYIYAPKMSGTEGANVEFENVMMIEDGENITIGSPLISGAKVNGIIQSHVKGDKVIVFRKKRRKGYKKKNGHRQLFTKVLIQTINK
ncbi:MAG: 50S ribosomal protein L21 [Chitinophagaceae bacterium]|nr:50S ribosomal protein L21 [Chitinophagaceae bacterium]